MKLLHEEFLTDEDNEIIELITEFNNYYIGGVVTDANYNILCDIIYANLYFYETYFNSNEYNKLYNYLITKSDYYKQLFENDYISDKEQQIIDLINIIDNKDKEIIDLKKLLNIIK